VLYISVNALTDDVLCALEQHPQSRQLAKGQSRGPAAASIIP
jgi:hypothetical protein